MSNVVELVTKEQSILNKFKPVKIEEFHSDENITEEIVKTFNRNLIVEQLASILVQEYIGDGKEMQIERFFDFQMKAYKTASDLLKECI